MSGRSFGGYSYQERVGTGVFGEVFRGVNGSGVEARIVHVAPGLAEKAVFAGALARLAEQMTSLAHPGVVGIRQVGRSGQQLVVLTDPVSGPVALADVLQRGGRLPADVGLAIGLAALGGLGEAHRRGFVHGAIHPRSVLIELHGAVRVADFGLAGALVEAAQESDEAGLLHGLRGYVAPELAVGQPASETSDVYAAGALVYELLHGEPPPGTMRASPRVAEVLARALAVDAAERIRSAGQLEEELERAVAEDGCPVAPLDRAARFLGERMAVADAALHAATDDLVAALAPVYPDGAARRPSGVRQLLARLESDDEPPGEMTDVDPHDVRGRGGLDLSGVLRFSPIEVPQRRRGATPEEDEMTPLPAPTPHRPGSVTRHLDELEAEERAARGERGPDGAVAVAAARGGARERRPRLLLWVGLTMFAVGALGAVLYTQSDWFDPARRRDAEREAEAAEAAARARHEAAQPRAGDVTVTAREPDAAVWLLLGRTPLDSMALSTEMVHELRLEHEGYRPLDVRVTAAEWNESGGALRARVHAELVQGAPLRPVPAYPAEAAGGTGEAPKGRHGRGVVRVESRPAGARVWLLIGFTPTATVTGLEAGRDYELKVLKDGFRPGFAAVRGADWYMSGPGGPMLTSVTREVALARVGRRPSRAHRRGRARRSGGDRD